MRIYLSFLTVSFLLFDTYWSCDPREEFVAGKNDFRNYDAWEVIDYTIGQSNPLLGGAHRGRDSRYSRLVYRNPAARLRGAEYPTGSIIVKETFTWKNGEKQFSPVDGILGMVKRGRRFNPDGNGWEWIFLSTEEDDIINRGGEEMGMCNTCHRYAVAQEGGADFVFAYPTEFMFEGRDIAVYRQWNRVNIEKGADPFLKEVEKVDDPQVMRRIYKKQLLARPIASEYPTGTIYIKEIFRQGYLVRLLAQVKRGGTFDPEHNNWEWFVIEPESNAIESRGADIAEGACIRCHSEANESGAAVDFVYSHPGDPFNK